MQKLFTSTPCPSSNKTSCFFQFKYLRKKSLLLLPPEPQTLSKTSIPSIPSASLPLSHTYTHYSQKVILGTAAAATAAEISAPRLGSASGAHQRSLSLSLSSGQTRARGVQIFRRARSEQAWQSTSTRTQSKRTRACAQHSWQSSSGAAA